MLSMIASDCSVNKSQFFRLMFLTIAELGTCGYVYDHFTPLHRWSLSTKPVHDHYTLILPCKLTVQFTGHLQLDELQQRSTTYGSPRPTEP